MLIAKVYMVLRQACKFKLKNFTKFLFPIKTLQTETNYHMKLLWSKYTQKIRNGWKYICHLTLYLGKIKRFSMGTL
jgi:hypothetical protein